MTVTIALPGETIEYKDDVLYINKEAVDEPYLITAKNESQKENLYLTEDFGPITIPEETIFVLGDNRQNSLDSRMIGPIPIDQIVGKMRDCKLFCVNGFLRNKKSHRRLYMEGRA
ncbi:signal peptidase [Brevibacillus panacihumi W25]|uniref:Signal peptidase I n=1 Tax=Brevibacillus panacihumi W25 TaxID=1408254 RepID=V6M520_9BACL|nr:signal peptidase I [Brevibacillus panacihumi]EST52975.1 signal peptidase [Brevibacillus panacihumi W25]